MEGEDNDEITFEFTTGEDSRRDETGENYCTCGEKGRLDGRNKSRQYLCSAQRCHNGSPKQQYP